MSIKAVRGAISVDVDSEDAMKSSIKELMRAIMNSNKLREKQIVSLHLNQTVDLTEFNAAAALRFACPGEFTEVPLFVSQEPHVKDAMEKVVRLILYVNVSPFKKLTPQYLRNAAALRPDLSNSNEKLC